MYARMYNKFSFFSAGQIVKVLDMNPAEGSIVVQSLTNPQHILSIASELASPSETVERLHRASKGRPAGTPVVFFLEGNEAVGYGFDGVELIREKY